MLGEGATGGVGREVPVDIGRNEVKAGMGGLARRRWLGGGEVRAGVKAQGALGERRRRQSELKGTERGRDEARGKKLPHRVDEAVCGDTAGGAQQGRGTRLANACESPGDLSGEADEAGMRAVGG